MNISYPISQNDINAVNQYKTFLLTKYKPIMTYQMVLNIMSTNPLVYYLETDFWLQKYTSVRDNELYLKAL